MSQASLTAKYRPQRFDEVAGQETTKAILSRAALEDKIAPAYLFSGTRGVGKTTLARILAKAINCEQAPTAEPCNKCIHCRQITSGAAIDVIEIDGASNRGIDDARRIKEDIGYAPMECRYKVFIIDEAHMLTRDAFNALLKTLEEPPGNTTFILATTEPHKFPATIISRCQHYTFKRLTQPGLEAHLSSILTQENVPYEDAALKIIGRRASGSVRDSMSLLGQVLALGTDSIKAEDVRMVLGLAGQEVFFRVLDAMEAQDVVAMSGVLHEILDQGLDLGFFLREFTNLWRNLFMLKQAGEAALPILEVPEEEGRTLLEWSQKFALTHIHACWQITLEGQRKVTNSLEPGLALELLLLNLAYLPNLVPLQNVQCAAGPAPASTTRQTAPQPQQPPQQRAQQQPPHQQYQQPQQQQYQQPAQQQMQQPRQQVQQQGYQGQQGHHPASQSAPMGQDADQESDTARSQPMSPPVREPQPPMAGPPPDHPAARIQPPEDITPLNHIPVQDFDYTVEGESEDPSGFDRPVENAAPHRMKGLPTWNGFSRFCTARGEQTGVSMNVLKHIDGDFEHNILQLHCQFETQYKQLSEGERHQELLAAAKEYFGPQVTVKVHQPTQKQASYFDMRQKAEKHPLVKRLKEEFGAQIMDVHSRDD